MRVVVATDAIGSLSSAQAGAALATGWPQAAVTVLPVGEAGGGFAQAVADRWRVELASGVLAGGLLSWAQRGAEVVLAVSSAVPTSSTVPVTATSRLLGEAVRHVLGHATMPVSRILLDCVGVDSHDGGAGLLAALGATADVALTDGAAGLAGISRLDLTGARDRLDGIDLVGVVPTGQLSSPLLGLRGITSVRGRAAGLRPESLLAVDATLQRFAALVSEPDAVRPGAGACGGVGFAVLGLGGRLTTGTAQCLQSTGAAALRGADLCVTGCTVFDFGTRGGGVVAEVARAAAEALCPCIAVAGEVLIGGREMRTMGVESAYPVRASSLYRPAGGDVTEPELSRVAARVARTWQW